LEKKENEIVKVKKEIEILNAGNMEAINTNNNSSNQWKIEKENLEKEAKKLKSKSKKKSN